MKTRLWPIAVSVVVLLVVVGRLQRDSGELSTAEEAPRPTLSDERATTLIETRPEPAASPVLRDVIPSKKAVDQIDDSAVTTDSVAVRGVIDLGEHINPDDPYAKPQDADTTPIFIGENIDPDDPSTWPIDGSPEPVIIGANADPDDPSTWPPELRSESVIVGENLDPDASDSWVPQESRDLIIIGEYIEVDEP